MPVALFKENTCTNRAHASEPNSALFISHLVPTMKTRSSSGKGKRQGLPPALLALLLGQSGDEEESVKEALQASLGVRSMCASGRSASGATVFRVFIEIFVEVASERAGDGVAHQSVAVLLRQGRADWCSTVCVFLRNLLRVGTHCL